MERLTFFRNGRWWILLNETVYGGFPEVDRLAAYEDIGLEPEEIKDILERYHAFRSAVSDETGQPMVGWTRAGEICRAEKDGRLVVLPPNDPLTLEQLREMDGEPVFIKRIGSDHPDDRAWALVDDGHEFCKTVDGVKHFLSSSVSPGLPTAASRRRVNMDYKELINRLRYNWVCPDDIADAVTAIETLLAERDAAVEDLRVGGCEVCKYKDFWGYDVPCKFCKEIGGMSDYWQWRGPQKGDGHGS